jgi:hypothetical protein
MNGERSIMAARDPAERMERLGQFGKALGVHPAYFAEWRRLWCLTLLDEVLTVAPGVSIQMWQRFSPHQPAAVGVRGPAYQSLNGRSHSGSRLEAAGSTGEQGLEAKKTGQGRP